MQVGYPGGIFAPFIPGDLAELKVKEIKNGGRCISAIAWAMHAERVKYLILASAGVPCTLGHACSCLLLETLISVASVL